MVDADRLARLLDHIRRDVGRLADTARRLREPPSREVESLDAVKYRFVTDRGLRQGRPPHRRIGGVGRGRHLDDFWAFTASVAAWLREA